MLIRLLLFIPFSFSAYDGSFRTQVRWVSPPATLYHWAGHHVFKTWGEKIQKLGKLTFPYRVTQGSVFATRWSRFKNKHGVFAWTDPVLGSQGGYSESYAANADLVVFRIRPDATALRLISSGDAEDYSEELNFLGDALKDVQLVEHITPTIHEWIILDPKAVEQFTADPDVTHPILAAQMMPYLEDHFTRPPLESIHYRNPGQSVPLWLSDSRPNWVASSLFGTFGRIYDNLDLNAHGPYSTAKARRERSYIHTYESPIHPAFTEGPWDSASCNRLMTDLKVRKFHELFKNLSELNRRSLGRE